MVINPEMKLNVAIIQKFEQDLKEYRHVVEDYFEETYNKTKDWDNTTSDASGPTEQDDKDYEKFYEQAVDFEGDKFEFCRENLGTLEQNTTLLYRVVRLLKHRAKNLPQPATSVDDDDTSSPVIITPEKRQPSKTRIRRQCTFYHYR